MRLGDVAALALGAGCSLALVASCGFFPRSHKHESTTSPTGALNARADSYCALEDELADDQGFVGTDCDLVLFNALRAVGCDATVNLTAAEDPATPGQWDRDPKRLCYAEGRTSARFSKDMAVGVLYWAWSTGAKALPVVERLAAYLEAHGGYLCEAKDAATRDQRCKVGAGLAATVYELRFRLGGADSPKRQAAAVFDPLADGSERHVQALHLYLRGLMFGAVTDPELYVLEQWGRANPLFAAMAAKFETSNLELVTSAVVDDEVKFPPGRLPTSADRCTDYLWQRNEGDDWLPCPPEHAPEAYSGIDLAFFRAVVADRLPVGEEAPATKLLGARVHRYQRNGNATAP